MVQHLNKGRGGERGATSRQERERRERGRGGVPFHLFDPTLSPVAVCSVTLRGPLTYSLSMRSGALSQAHTHTLVCPSLCTEAPPTPTDRWLSPLVADVSFAPLLDSVSTCSY